MTAITDAELRALAADLKDESDIGYIYAKLASLRDRTLAACQDAAEELSPDVLAAVEEALDIASEAGPYAGEYFDNKWKLTERWRAAEGTLRPWLDYRTPVVVAKPPRAGA